MRKKKYCDENQSWNQMFAFGCCPAETFWFRPVLFTFAIESSVYTRPLNHTITNKWSSLTCSINRIRSHLLLNKMQTSETKTKIRLQIIRQGTSRWQGVDGRKWIARGVMMRLCVQIHTNSETRTNASWAPLQVNSVANKSWLINYVEVALPRHIINVLTSPQRRWGRKQTHINTHNAACTLLDTHGLEASF